ncbi:MAG: hypothetical protein ACREUV_02385 [Burkholderiales bacterium]
MCYEYEWFDKAQASEMLKKSKDQVEGLIKQAQSVPPKQEKTEKQLEQEPAAV